MSVMTVKITPYDEGASFGTMTKLPHQRGKCIFGFARDVEDAKRRVIDYAGEDVTFIIANKK